MIVLLVITIISLSLSLVSLIIALFWRRRIVIELPETLCTFEGMALSGRTLRQIAPGVIPFSIIPYNVTTACIDEMIQGKKFKIIVREVEDGDFLDTLGSHSHGAGVDTGVYSQPVARADRTTLKRGMLYRLRKLINGFNNGKEKKNECE